ncbi:MAG: hypothetical protein IKJ59_07185 [Clostridia bacterium]|nr:hypothetical protein [Clostridia bacterium]
MKKLVCFIIIVSTIFLYGCSNAIINPDTSENEQTEAESTLPNINYNENVILPNVKVKSTNLAKEFKNLNLSNFTIINAIGDAYYGYKSTYSDNGINDEFMLIYSQSEKEMKLKSPQNIINWSVGSGSMVVLNDRYLYEWKSYTSEFAEESAYDVKLTRIDCENGTVEIVDELKYNTPLIYMCKISDTEFLSYSITQGSSDKTEYATISTAWIYNINGEKKEIINERYENDINWTDSEGILIEHFAVKDGKLFGLGRRQVAGKYKFFLYQYDKNGKLINEEVLIGFENIIGSEQMLELHLIGDYIAFRTYESLTTYICKKSDVGIELIMKGTDRQVQYAVSSKFIFFIESNVNVYSGEIEQKECPLYIIDIQNDKVYATDFIIDLENPYFVGIQSLSDESLLVMYCESGIYNPLNIKHYLIDKETIEAKMREMF